jgi:hypothetical protein
VRSEVAPSWSAYAEKIGYRADSVLVQLSEREFEEGLTALREYSAVVPEEPVIELVNFFCFRRIWPLERTALRAPRPTPERVISGRLSAAF